jgi:transcriptional regulator with XRE-family HTH domain
MTLGEKIQRVRQILRVERKSIAAHLQISTQHYANIENNVTPIDAERLGKIASFLGVDQRIIESFDTTFVLNQTNNDSSVGYGYVQNLYQQNQELLEKIMDNQQKIIEHLIKTSRN